MACALFALAIVLPVHRCAGDPAMLRHASHGPWRSAGRSIRCCSCRSAWRCSSIVTGWVRLSQPRIHSAVRRRDCSCPAGPCSRLALVSPLHEAGERSFTMHMIEHELIMLVATLLLASSSTGGVLAWGLPRPLRLSLGGSWKSPLQSLWKRLTEPVTATAIQAVVMWVWHAPALVRPSARQLRLAHRPACVLLHQLAAVLVGDAPPARARRLRRLGRVPVRDVADRRSARRADELLVDRPGMPIMRRWA